MNRPQSPRRGVVTGISALAGLAAAALGVVGVAQHDGVTAQQRDVALTAGAEDVASQVTADNAFFNSQNALQEQIYHSFGSAGFLLAPGDPSDPQDSIYNGAFSRFTDAQLVSMVMQQAQQDHADGANVALGPGGYETALAGVLTTDIGGAAPGSSIAADLAAVSTAAASGSYSGFESALTALDGALVQNAFSDLLGMLFHL